MAQLSTQNIPSPGSFGVNTEDAGVVAPTRYAKAAYNCVVTTDNRLAARKHLDPFPCNTAFTGNVKQIIDIVNVDGTKEYIWSTETKIFAGYPTTTDITGALTITDGDWDFANLQNTLVAFQRNHTPAAWRKIAGVWTPQTFTFPTEISTEKPNVCLGAFGRIFLASGTTIKNKIWFSEDLNPLNFSTAGAGSLDISKAIVGNDSIIGLASFGNRLIILCEKQVIIYTVDLTATVFLSLDEVIKGVGCVSRDSVVNTGDDLVWLAKQGMVSLGRLTSSDGQLPIGDISTNVHSLLQTTIDAVADRNEIKACWWEAERSVLLLFPSQDRMFVFNIRVRTDNGPAVTMWNTLKNTKCMTSDIDRNLFFGGVNGTWWRYIGYGNASDSYLFSYFSGYLDMGDPTTFKNLKSISFSVRTGSSQTSVVKWAFDYSDLYQSDPTLVTGIGGVASEYGISEYGVAEFSAGPQIYDLRTIGALSGQYLQYGIESQIVGNEYVLYNTEIQVTAGKKF